MDECVVCWSEITDGSESTLVLSKVARKVAKEELGLDACSEVLICQHCIQDIIADYFV